MSAFAIRTCLNRAQDTISKMTTAVCENKLVKSATYKMSKLSNILLI
jgi:hypothetical protein